MQARSNSGRGRVALRRLGAVGLAIGLVPAVGAFGGRPSADTSSGSANLPITYAQAKAQGKKIDFGPNCDTSTGNIKVPSVYAAPCVPPFTGDNGGATSPGVTKDTITIAVYQGDPKLNPLQASVIKGAGADVDLSTAQDTYKGYTTYYSDHYELYGRKVKLVFVKGSGAPTDTTASKNDAIKIATQIKPFAVWDGPLEDGGAFAQELAARNIMCLGTCAVAIPTARLQQETPYPWSTAPTPEQSAMLTAEMVGKEFGNGTKAKYAGSALKKKKRVFGVAHYDTAAGDQRPSFDVLVNGLKKYNVKVKTDISYLLDLTKVQETARTLISKLKSAGVTTVILTGDPLTPQYLTKEATAQNYFPEWIIGPNVFIDLSLFGRQYDQQQWVHAFGIELNPARGVQKTQDSYNIYHWQFGQAPPNNTYAVLNGSPSVFFVGAQLAGPDLTPQTFQQALFSAPVRGGGPATPIISWGHHNLWPETDLGGADDAALIWWNSKAKGQDEVGNNGTGLYEYANGGTRYVLGKWPKTDKGVFDKKTSVTILKKLTGKDQPPSYPSPATK